MINTDARPPRDPASTRDNGQMTNVNQKEHDKITVHKIFTGRGRC